MDTPLFETKQAKHFKSISKDGGLENYVLMSWVAIIVDPNDNKVNI